MANMKLSELIAAGQLDANDLLLITDTATGESRSILGQDILDYVEGNIDIPTGISDISGLQSALDDKANIVHTHIINDVTGLQTALDSKYDSSTAGITGNTIIIGGNAINIIDVVDDRVADITSVSPTDGRIPTSVTPNNFLQFTSHDGSIGEVTEQQLKADLLINNVDNTADLNKPISSAVQDALDTKVDVTAFSEGQAAQDALIAVNTAKTGITDEQSAEITANTAKRSYPQADEDKLDGIESGADVTDTANVWPSLGISAAGRTNYALSERGVFVQIPDSAGNVAPVLTGVTTEQVSISSGGGMVVFTITGINNNVVNANIVNSTPANWITNTSLDITEVDLGVNGEATVTATVPSFSDLTGSRSFQLQVQVDGAFQPAITSEVVTQYSASQLITGISLSAVSFGNNSVVETINVAGIAGEGYSLELFDVTPAGWITSGALSATTGLIGADGTDSSNTISIPSAQDDTVNRSFRLRARATDDNTLFAESSVIVQVHTQSSQAGNLIADAGALVVGNDINFTVTVSQGDAPFTAVVNQNATDATDNPLRTITFSDVNMIQAFTALAASDFTGPTANFYVHISDNDGDVVVEMETLTLTNDPPTGNISQTMGATSPASESTVEFTAAFTDPEGDALSYQWQYQDPLKTFTAISDTPHSFSGDVGAGYSVSTWNGSTTLSEVLGFTVASNSLQGFLVVTGFGGDVVTASIIESNTTDSINLFSEGGAVTNPLGWFNARLYDNTYTNIAGETDSVLGFEWRDFAALDQEEITIGAVFAPDGFVDIDSYTYSGSSIVTPGFNFIGGDAISFVYDDDANTVVLTYAEDISASMMVIPSDFTFTFNIAGGGAQTVSPSTLPGLYRVRVTDSETEALTDHNDQELTDHSGNTFEETRYVYSNELELT